MQKQLHYKNSSHTEKASIQKKNKDIDDIHNVIHNLQHIDLVREIGSLKIAYILGTLRYKALIITNLQL